VKNRSTIFSVYGPVLLAALLFFTAAPACAMPDCGPNASKAAAPTGANGTQFKSACELDKSHVPADSGPCGGGNCDETVMSHGTPAATAATGVTVPAATAVAQAPTVPALISLSISRAPAARPQPDPPDPLGVRLSV